MKDTLGDKIKAYEAASEFKFIPNIPVIVRIDGRSFHTFTKGMERPFYAPMSRCMIETTMELVKRTNAVVGYTQSDEITLVYYTPSKESQIFFDGRHSKMVSNLASIATLCFYRACQKNMPEYCDKMPTFDCRAFQVPSKEEAAEVLHWRELDAFKNSVSMAARAYYSDKELLGISGKEKQEMLFKKGINFNDYPIFFKRGTFIMREVKNTKCTTDEINKLPKNHAARSNPDLEIKRYVFVEKELPPLSKVTNKVEVFFDGKEPILKKGCK